MLLNNERVNNEIKEEVKEILETNENEQTTVQNHWDIINKHSPEMKVRSYTGLPKNDRKISNKQPKPISKRTGGTTTKARVSIRREIIKMRTD